MLTRFVISGVIPVILLSGQSLSVAPSQTDLKTSGVFSVSIDSPQGKAPAALQWEFSVPPAIAITPADIAIGKAAESVRKSLTCAKKETPAKQRAVKYACILAGGQHPIGNGPIAVVHYRAQWDVKGVPIKVAIENILGASADLKRIPIPNADALIDIR
jgi:hypothetical protein